MWGFRILSILCVLVSFNVKAECLLQDFAPMVEQVNAPQLYIFVSFTMPEQSLKLLAEQASRVNGVLLFRGFLEDDVEKTTAKTYAVFGENISVEIAIDPERFQQFKIEAVPAVVIAQPESTLEDKNSSPPFDVVTGDTSLEEALQRIAKEGTVEGQKAAQQFLNRYRGACE